MLKLNLILGNTCACPSYTKAYTKELRKTTCILLVLTYRTGTITLTQETATKLRITQWAMVPGTLDKKTRTMATDFTGQRDLARDLEGVYVQQ